MAQNEPETPREIRPDPRLTSYLSKGRKGEKSERWVGVLLLEKRLMSEWELLRIYMVDGFIEVELSQRSTGEFKRIELQRSTVDDWAEARERFEVGRPYSDDSERVEKLEGEILAQIQQATGVKVRPISERIGF